MRAARSAFASAPPGRLRRARRLTAGLAAATAAAALLTALAAGPAGAQVGPILPPAPHSGVFLESWALAPSGVDPSQPSSRPNVTYLLAPGATQHDSVTLWNYSDAQLTFHIYATDAYNNPTGEFTLLPGYRKPRDAGTWVKLSTNFVTAPPRTKIDIPFTTTVPAKTSPGDHIGGIVASLPTSTASGKGQPLTVDRRTGSRLYVRVAGRVNAGLVVENLGSTYHPALNPLDGTLNVTYTLRNDGNVRLGARQAVAVHDLFGRTVKTHKVRLVPEVLPGNAITYHEHFTGIPATLRVGAEVTVKPLEPIGVADKPPSASSYATHTLAIPWTLLLVLALALLGWRLYRRYRTQQATPGAAGGGPRGAGPSGPGVPPTGPTRQREPVLRFSPPPPGGATPP